MLKWLLLAALQVITAVLSETSASVSVFDDGNAFLQIISLSSTVKWVVVLSDDLKLKLDVTVDGNGVVRSALGPIRYYSGRKFCLVVPHNDLILCSEIQKRVGKLNFKSFPQFYELPSVSEINALEDGLIYSFTSKKLQVNTKFQSKIANYKFPLVDHALRGANLKMKENQKVMVHLSLTTSPNRLQLLHYTLSSLDLTLVDNVFVTLPYRFKDKFSYEIPLELQSKFPKVKFLKTEKDFGPVLKITGAAQYVYENLKDPYADRSIFLIIDDDQYYSLRTLDTLIYYSLMNPELVVTAATHRYYNHNTFAWPYNFQSNSKDLPGKLALDCEGFAGVAFRGYQIDYPLMLFFADKERDPDLFPCHLSDDVNIALVLQLNGHSIFALHHISSPMFYSRFERFDLPNFVDENALHRLNADGSLNTKTHTHKSKYDVCLTQLQSYYLNRHLEINLPDW